MSSLRQLSVAGGGEGEEPLLALHLSHNNITVVPSSWLFPRLLRLDLSNNVIDKLPMFPRLPHLMSVPSS